MHGIRYTIVLCAVMPAVAGIANGQCEEAKLYASDGHADSLYGLAVAAHQGVAVVGGSGFDSPDLDAVYVYCWDGSAWAGETKLTASDGEGWDGFGASIDISDGVLIGGASGDRDHGFCTGSAYIFRRDGWVWTEEAKLLASDGSEWDCFGRSVVINGDVAVIGASGDSDNGEFAGSVYFFARDGMEWTEQAELYASDAGEGQGFGYAIALAGDTMLIGAPRHDEHGHRSGAAYVFRFDGSTWTEEARLFASDPDVDDRFGQDVALSGDIAVIGTYADDQLGLNAGAAYVFRFDGQQWTQQAKLLASDGQPWDQFGLTVALAGDVALIGARGSDGYSQDSGAVYVFHRQGAQWVEVAKLAATDGEYGDYFGGSVALYGGRALIGAPWTNGIVPHAGAAYVFNLDSTPGDVDCDGDVDEFDVTLVLGAWGPCAYCPEDVNGDDIVNVLDLLIVLANWS